MKKNFHYTPVILALLIVLRAINCLGQVDSCAAWSTQEGDVANIYIAEQRNGVWQNAEKITNRGGVNITPAVLVAENDDIWLVWVKVDGDKRTLEFFARQQDVEVTGEVPSLPDKPCFSPSIVIDHLGKPWLTWTIDDGTDEDIYYSRWEGSEWQYPRRVHPDNAIPDITPTIGLTSNGELWITWKTFDGNGYISRTVFWNQDSWQSFSENQKQHTFQSITKSQSTSLPSFPDAAENRLMGSLSVRGGGEIQSMSERIFQFTPRRRP